MPSIEDFTTYTEVDPNGDFTITASKITIDTLGYGPSAYVYYDKGVNHFDGDFEFLAEYESGAGAGSGRFFVVVLANAVNDWQDLADANESALAVRCHAYDTELMAANEMDSGTLYGDNFSGTDGVLYYLKVKRDESVGTYGTYYIYIYSDAARTNLFDTLSIALHSSKKDYRYIYGVMSQSGAFPNETLTGYVQNLDLQEVPLAVPKSQGFIF